METTQDCSYIQGELLASRQKADRLLGAFDSPVSIVGIRQSLKEARSVGTLTRLDMVFLPLSLVAGLFSMSDRCQPILDRFWLCFAVSALPVLLKLGVAWLLTEGPRLVSEVTRILARGEEVPRQRMDRRDNWGVKAYRASWNPVAGFDELPLIPLLSSLNS